MQLRPREDEDRRGRDRATRIQPGKIVGAAAHLSEVCVLVLQRRCDHGRRSPPVRLTAAWPHPGSWLMSSSVSSSEHMPLYRQQDDLARARYPPLAEHALRLVRAMCTALQTLGST